ncbi:hypothetical protein [Sphingobacterium bambusae]|uniref:Plasmid transfer protein n=1 Tax=Sphingobacterium bambusae TaxID=662858 RepID=A0ABW6BAG2_9SPHI|nr:hypothetical protein [Sphingobacterium bambusae]WPL48524.1 hypothetical protein SCB77_21480 [Sphingobacterium bambusae]
MGFAKYLIICVLCFLCLRSAFAQSYVTIVYDAKHLAIVGENAAVRSAAELTHHEYLKTINNRLDDININLFSVVMVQRMIHGALTEVDQALKSGLMLKQVGSISSEIIAECNSILETTKGAPHLLLFAEDVTMQMKDRGIRLVSEVSDFVLKEGSNVLMDYEKRDALLVKILLELRVMRALCFSVHRAMYWAKLRGIIPSLNPFQSFINRDRQLVDQIIFQYNLLK